MALALAIPLGDVEWLRPNALWTLVLPLLVLLLARRRARPESVAVGTFAIWTRIGGAAEGARSRRRLPLWALLLVLSLTAGALALARPRRTAATPPLRWTVVVDRSPSMYLEHTDAGGAPTGAGTRLAAATDALTEWLGASAAEAGADVEVEWLAPDASGSIAAHRDFPSEWERPPRFPAESPEWALFDRPGFIWLTDGRVRPSPARAGQVAAGGGPVPGPVGSVGSTRLDWDGAEVREREGATARRRVAVDATVPPVLRAFVMAWAEERGLRIGGEPGPGVVLEVRAHGTGDVRAVDVGRDGWSTRGRAARAPLELDDRALAVWLAASETRAPIVTRGPGLVATSLVSMGDPRGDPAAFAVSWAAVLDEACLPAPDVVAIEERVAVGNASLSSPEVRDEAGPAGELPPMPLDTALAIAAAVLAVLASACSALRPSGPAIPRETGGSSS